MVYICYSHIAQISPPFLFSICIPYIIKCGYFVSPFVFLLYPQTCHFPM